MGGMTGVLGQALGELLDRSGERDLYGARIDQAYREGWRAGQAEGYGMGRADEAAERDRAWKEIARPAARGGLSHAELERRRWAVRGEPRTRETFGQPHPDDYQGRKGTA